MMISSKSGYTFQKKLRTFACFCRKKVSAPKKTLISPNTTLNKQFVDDTEKTHDKNSAPNDQQRALKTLGIAKIANFSGIPTWRLFQENSDVSTGFNDDVTIEPMAKSHKKCITTIHQPRFFRE